jgi:magnesium chelatase family protein
MMPVKLLPKTTPIVKRLLDIVLTLTLLIFLSPVLLIISIFVACQHGFPILFRQQRPGLFGEIFTIYKFRTMRNAFDQQGKPLPDEKRLTKLGRFLRSTSLDELPEFKKNALEALRQPLEDGTITITRSAVTAGFPAKFMLVAAMNPCPCGYFGDRVHRCRCSPQQIRQYQSKISGPLLDRIDLHIEVPSVKYRALMGKEESESSAEIRKRVHQARHRQKKRFGDTGVATNARMTEKQIRSFCPLDDESHALMEMAIEKLGLSARAMNRILKVSRTIADLAGSGKIEPSHVAEAIQYRSLDRSIV